MSTTVLRTKQEVQSLSLVPTIISLMQLWAKNPAAFNDLVLTCRDPEHTITEDRETLRGSLVQGITDEGQLLVIPEVRNIVLATVEGDNPDYKFVSAT